MLRIADGQQDAARRAQRRPAPGGAPQPGRLRRPGRSSSRRLVCCRKVEPPSTICPRLRPRRADCTGHVVPGARPCALGTFSYLVSSTSYFRLSYPNRFL